MQNLTVGQVRNTLFSTLAGLCGALAIAAYAGAAHGGENHLGNIAPCFWVTLRLFWYYR